MFSHPVEFFPLVTETPMVTEAGLMSIRIPASDAPEGHVDPRYICYMLSVGLHAVTVHSGRTAGFGRVPLPYRR